MFENRNRKNGKLDDCIDKILASMDEYGPEAPEYPDLLKKLEKLYKLKSKNDRRQVSPEVLWTVAGNVLCVLIIVGYEQRNVLTSKAMTFVGRIVGKR